MLHVNNAETVLQVKYPHIDSDCFGLSSEWARASQSVALNFIVYTADDSKLDLIPTNTHQ